MQRRAAAVYVAFFLVVGAVSFTLIATATEPAFSVEDPEYTLEPNESFTLDGQQYTVASITAERGDAEGSGPAPIERSGVIRWTNRSAAYAGEWTNGSIVTYNDESWNVSLPRGDVNNSTQFSLVEPINRTAILRNDSSVANRTTTVDGVEYVVRQSNGTRTLVPADEYFPEPETIVFQRGETFEYEGNRTTVADIGNQVVALEWHAPRTNEVNVGNNANVTLGGSTWFAHFPTNDTLELTQDYEQYQLFQEEQAVQTDNINGLWGVTILSGLSVIFLAGLAYLPSRY